MMERAEVPTASETAEAVRRFNAAFENHGVDGIVAAMTEACRSDKHGRSGEKRGRVRRPAGVRRTRTAVAIVALALLLPAFTVAQEDAAPPARPPEAPAAAPGGGPSSGGPSGDNTSADLPGEPPPDATAQPPPAPPISLDNVVEAVDRTHETVSDTLNRSVAWFDSFFSDRRFLEEGIPESFFRLRTGARVRQRDGTKFLGRVHANLVMPGTKRRLRVIIEGTGDEEETGVLPADATEARFDGGDAEQGSLQALYEFIRRLDINVSLRGGARFHFPIDPFLKLRFRYTRPLETKSLLRVTQDGFVTVQEGPGETTRIDIEHQLAPWTVLRWTVSGTLAESNPGYIWGTELSLFRQFTRRTAVTVEAGIAGQVHPVAVKTNHVVKIRFRQNVFRPWLFYEVEPELSWPRDERGAYPPTWAGTLLVELQFGTPREAPSAGPPPSDPPPKDGGPDRTPGPR